MRGNTKQIKMCPPLHKISSKSWIWYYEYMEAYMGQALFAITVAAFMKSAPNDDVALQGFEFRRVRWTTNRAPPRSLSWSGRSWSCWLSKGCFRTWHDPKTTTTTKPRPRNPLSRSTNTLRPIVEKPLRHHHRQSDPIVILMIVTCPLVRLWSSHGNGLKKCAAWLLHDRDRKMFKSSYLQSLLCANRSAVVVAQGHAARCATKITSKEKALLHICLSQNASTQKRQVCKRRHFNWWWVSCNFAIYFLFKIITFLKF